MNFRKLDDKTREKIYYNIKKSQFVQDNELFKKLIDFIWEFRTFYNSKYYRLFSFWGRINGKKYKLWQHMEFKKDPKTPAKEIKKAEEIRKEYFNNKKKINNYGK